MPEVHDKPRRRWRWWHVYVLLLIASHVTIMLRSRDQPLPDSMHAVDVATQTADASQPGTAVSIAYSDTGSPFDGAPVLVLLHGSPGSASNFDRLTPLLAPHARVIAIDLPGFGHSSRWVPDYSIRAHARYVWALLDKLDVDRVHVLGFSMGSGVAAEMESLAPSRVQSLIFYGGIGIQEGEGSGDYHFEHLKYGIGYATLVVLPELLPHFGLLGPRAGRHAFIRNFHDTDQRPLEGMLRSLRKPLLILHGRDDPLVFDWVAREHHDIVPDSELVMFDASHFMVFNDAGSKQLADEIVPFVARHSDPSVPAARRTLDHTADMPRKPPLLPVDLQINRRTGPWVQITTIILASFVLEDPTTITVGLLIRDRQLDLFVGVLAIFVGIFIGDLGLYAMGYCVGRPVLRWKRIRRALPAQRIDALGAWFDRHGWSAVLASRFIPGTRLPLYVSAGVLGRRPGRFFWWTCAAVAIWAPVMIALVLLFGEAAVSPFKLLFGDSWLAVVGAVLTLWMLAWFGTLLVTREGRWRLRAKVQRLWRYEFWPMWAFYAPLAPYWLWLYLRHGGLKSLTAVNPGMPHSGIVGESKADILSRLPARWVLSFALLPVGGTEARVAQLRSVMTQHGWSFPLILKPNEGQRGHAVRLAHDIDEARAIIADHAPPLLAQVYHPGPLELGVFYYRMPGEARGHIFSITDKQFPFITGDGKHTLEELLWRHPRYRMQAATFLQRHGDQRDRVLEDGETMRLAMAGNHCQGTLFRDGAHLITDALESRVNDIAQQYEGFYFGRFDVRFADVERFKAGDEFAIVELNGVTSESTNIYDPGRNLLWAYRTLARQWRIAFTIGAMNRRLGATGTSKRELWRIIRSHYRQRTLSNLSD